MTVESGLVVKGWVIVAVALAPTLGSAAGETYRGLSVGPRGPLRSLRSKRLQLPTVGRTPGH